MVEKFQIVLMESVLDFLSQLDEKDRAKILSNLDKAKNKTDNTLFKKLNSDIWEFRTIYNKKQYRLFAFWNKTDSEMTIVVATHGIIKKTKKTPLKEIQKATEIMNKYFKTRKK